MRPILREVFYHDGRGPSLVKAHYSSTGSLLVAADYLNPDASSEQDLRHLLFAQPQVFMFTPEEVENSLKHGPEWDAGTAAVCLGRSSWLESFAPQHLERCEHYRFMFYDEYLDLICEGVESKTGGYRVA